MAVTTHGGIVRMTATGDRYPAAGAQVFPSYEIVGIKVDCGEANKEFSIAVSGKTVWSHTQPDTTDDPGSSPMDNVSIFTGGNYFTLTTDATTFSVYVNIR